LLDAIFAALDLAVRLVVYLVVEGLAAAFRWLLGHH
jgi:hypothetical protein